MVSVVSRSQRTTRTRLPAAEGIGEGMNDNLGFVLGLIFFCIVVGVAIGALLTVLYFCPGC